MTTNNLFDGLQRREQRWLQLLIDSKSALETAKEEMDFRGSKKNGVAFVKVNNTICAINETLRQRAIVTNKLNS